MDVAIDIYFFQCLTDQQPDIARVENGFIVRGPDSECLIWTIVKCNL